MAGVSNARKQHQLLLAYHGLIDRLNKATPRGGTTDVLVLFCLLHRIVEYPQRGPMSVPGKPEWPGGSRPV